MEWSQPWNDECYRETSGDCRRWVIEVIDAWKLGELAGQTDCQREAAIVERDVVECFAAGKAVVERIDVEEVNLFGSVRCSGMVPLVGRARTLASVLVIALFQSFVIRVLDFAPFLDAVRNACI